MADDLDSFLQRAAQQRQKRKQAEIVILEPSSPAPAPRPAPSRPLAPPPAPPPRTLATPVRAQPVVVIAEPVKQQHEDISKHVATHLDSREFEQRAAHLGERVGMADDDLQAHLQQVFAHSVGSLGRTGQTLQSAQDIATAEMSVQILATFRDPQSLRRAIIMNEVLQPPTHRW